MAVTTSPRSPLETVTIRTVEGTLPVPRILVLRALALGDFLAAVPAYRALRRAFPRHRVLLAAPAGLAPLVPLTGAVDALVPVPGLGHPIPWNGGPPDVAVNLHGRGPGSHRMLDAMLPRKVLTFAHSSYPHLRGARWRAGEHETSRWCRLLTHYGIPADPADLTLAVPEVPPPALGSVVVHPGAGAPSRRWPADRFAAVAAALRRAGHHVVVTGTVGERRLCEQVARQAGLPAASVLAGRTGLVNLAALVSAARLVVSNDTGVAHLATAYRVPSVVLFGPTGPDEWGPPPDRPWHRALWGARGSGDRDAPGPDPSLLDVTAARVLRTATDLLHSYPPALGEESGLAGGEPARAGGTGPGRAGGSGRQREPGAVRLTTRRAVTRDRQARTVRGARGGWR